MQNWLRPSQDGLKWPRGTGKISGPVLGHLVRPAASNADWDLATCTSLCIAWWLGLVGGICSKSWRCLMCAQLGMCSSTLLSTHLGLTRGAWDKSPRLLRSDCAGTVSDFSSHNQKLMLKGSFFSWSWDYPGCKDGCGVSNGPPTTRIKIIAGYFSVLNCFIKIKTKLLSGEWGARIKENLLLDLHLVHRNWLTGIEIGSSSLLDSTLCWDTAAHIKRSVVRMLARPCPAGDDYFVKQYTCSNSWWEKENFSRFIQDTLKMHMPEIH